MAGPTPGVTEGTGSGETAQQRTGSDLGSIPALAQADQTAAKNAVEPVLNNNDARTRGVLVWMAHSFKADEQGKPVFTPSVLNQETERMRTNENSNSTEKALGYDFETASIQYQLSNLSLDIQQNEFFLADSRVSPYQKAQYKQELGVKEEQQRVLSAKLNKLQEARKNDASLASEPNQVQALAKKLGVIDAETIDNPLGGIMNVLNRNNSREAMDQLFLGVGNQLSQDEREQLLSLTDFMSGKQDKKNFLSAMGGGIFSLLLMFLMKKMLEGGQRQQ